MKKIVLFISVLCLTVMAGAQEHLKFKNIPIDGPKQAFIDELQKNEFHLIDNTDFGASLRGHFTGKPVSAFVMTTSEGNVCRVAVNYDAPDNWASLRLDYYTLLRSLSYKYGKAVEMTQEFQFPFADGDGREIEAFQKRRATWYARFVSPEGTIHLVIGNSPMNERPSINLFYEDAINCQRQDEINSEDL
jgi:hypothetical protein